jgi:hypothetical protein
MGTEVGNFDSVESKEVAKEGGTRESQPAVKEAEEDDEFILTPEWFGFLAWDSPLILRLFWEDPGLDVGDQ